MQEIIEIRFSQSVSAILNKYVVFHRLKYYLNTSNWKCPPTAHLRRVTNKLLLDESKLAFISGMNINFVPTLQLYLQEGNHLLACFVVTDCP
jgi:hypothetical protein